MSSPPRRARCVIVCPREQRGGGMGRVTGYLIQAARQDKTAPQYLAVDPRGPWHIALSPVFLAAAVARMAVGAMRGEIALVHVNVADRYSLLRKGLVILSARLLRLPVVLHQHAGEIIGCYAKLPRPLKWSVRAMFRCAQCCIVVGEPWRRFVIDELGVDARKVVVLYNGVPRTTALHRSAGATDALRILFLGNLQERKGVSDLLEAVAREPVVDMKWRLTLAGGGAIEHYRRQAESLGLLSRVDFPGWVDQQAAATLLADSDVLVLPSYGEGLPLVVLEALAVGVPVVCTPVGSIPEILENEETALFIRPHDPQGLADALARLAQDPGLRRRLSSQGRVLYEREFRIEIFVERLVRIYRGYCGFPEP